MGNGTANVNAPAPRHATKVYAPAPPEACHFGCSLSCECVILLLIFLVLFMGVLAIYVMVLEIKQS